MKLMKILCAAGILTTAGAPITVKAVEIIPEVDTSAAGGAAYSEYMYVTGWFKQSNGKWSYYNPQLLTSSWIKDKGKWYYINPTGAMVANTKYTVGDFSNPQAYFFNSDGSMATNKWLKTALGWNYFGASGKMVRNNWAKVNGVWYYFDSFGFMLSNTTQVINGVSYTFDASGAWIG